MLVTTWVPSASVQIALFLKQTRNYEMILKIGLYHPFVIQILYTFYNYNFTHWLLLDTNVSVLVLDE